LNHQHAHSVCCVVNMVRVRRVALLGYPAVGKSSLAYQFVENRFDDEYCTTIENHLTREIQVAGKDYEIHLYDTMGVTELPTFSDNYLTMDGWILVYSVDNDRSFSVIKEIYEKLAVSVQSPPLVVVGNKTDLDSVREISEKQGRELASGIGAMYTESSAKDAKGVDDVFVKMIKQIDKDQGKEEKDCTIL